MRASAVLLWSRVPWKMSRCFSLVGRVNVDVIVQMYTRETVPADRDTDDLEKYTFLWEGEWESRGEQKAVYDLFLIGLFLFF